MSSSDRKKSGESCPECALDSFARNHYFTGKLMQVGDFDTEQRYGVDKLRLHNRALHGWGTVCGLNVKQHPQPACQSRFVCVEPGLAIDGCGREIVLGTEDCVDITQLSAVKALDPKDTNPHVLQICIRYRECPTEEVPVFYDDGCDGDRCAPNRILESYEFDAIIDPKTIAGSPGQPKLKWVSTINPGGAYAVAVTAGSPGYLYATSQYQNTVFQIETEHYSVVGTAPLPGPGANLAVSADGTVLYVVSLENIKTDPFFSMLNVFDTSGTLSGPPHVSFGFPNGQDSIVSLAVAPDNRLIALLGAYGMEIWPTTLGLPSQTTAPNPDAQVPLSGFLAGLVISSDGTHAYSADSEDSQIVVLNVAPGSGSTAGTPIPLSGFSPTGLALVPAATGDLIAVINNATPAQFALVDPVAGLLAAVDLANEPVSLAVSADGKWAYVLENDASKNSSIQVIDLAGLQKKKTVTPSAPFPTAAYGNQIVLSPTGRTLYVPFSDGSKPQGPSGIAVIDISETDCQEHLWGSLDGCPDCGHPHCVVLATIDGYQAGFSIEDPPASPKTDAINQIARIDNRKGRRLLPSVENLYEFLECIKATLAGKPGPTGPPGPQGVQGPQGAVGPGLEQGLTRILLPSWPHDGVISKFSNITRLTKETGKGLWIQFTAPVIVNTIEPEYVFQVQVRKSSTSFLQNPWISLGGVVFPVKVDASNNAMEIDMTVTPTPSTDTVAFFWSEKQAAELKGYSEFQVRFRGDFVLDGNGNAVDAQFVRAQLPTGQVPKGGLYGIEGGTFESWFVYQNSSTAN